MLFVSLKRKLKNHYLAIIIAALVGFIYIAPNLIFILTLGDKYKGIPMMQTSDEDFYLARIQEIIDGHPAVSSSAFFEYKDQWPISPPTGEYFYAAPSLIFGISPVNALIASRFFLTFALFLLVYFLVRSLTLRNNSRSGMVNSIACALLITLGYDLVDYHSLARFFAGKDILTGGFLMWSRPINPILGAVFLFAFLNFAWQVIRKTPKRKIAIGGASLSLALMVSSYFFSWGVALSVWGVLALTYLLKREYAVVKNLFWIIVCAALLSSPYWYSVWQASKSPLYKESILQDGLFYTHYPLLNKLMLVVLGVYLAGTVVIPLFKKRHSDESLCSFLKNLFRDFQNWHWFILAFIIGSLWAYSQQIITGRTIWPYHFVQYTIPLAMVSFLVLLYNTVKPAARYLWMAGITVVIFSSLLFGVYVQVSVYKRYFPYHVDQQSYARLFSWLNEQKKDCVVLVTEKANKRGINELIPAFTHCNVYTSPWVFSMIPYERLLHNYLVMLKLRGIKSGDINKYLAKNMTEVRGYISSNWQGRYGVREFPDFSDDLLWERARKFPGDFKKFADADFKKELGKYRLDYIISEGELPDDIFKELPGTGIVFRSDNNMVVYGFKGY